MSMLRRGYGAVRNLRCKSGARFPPSTDWMYLAKTYRRALGPWLVAEFTTTLCVVIVTYLSLLSEG